MVTSPPNTPEPTFSPQRSTQLVNSFGIFCLISSVLLVSTGLVLSFRIQKNFQDSFYPHVLIDSIPVAGKTPEEAQDLLREQQKTVPAFSVTLGVDDISIASSSAELGFRRTHEKAFAQAMAVGRKEHFFAKWWRLLSPNAVMREFASTYEFDQEKVTQLIQELAKRVDVVGEEPAAKLRVSQSAGSLEILRGKVGRAVNQEETQKVFAATQKSESFSVPAAVASTAATLSDEQAKLALERSKKLVAKALIFRADNVFTRLNDQRLIRLLAFPDGISDSEAKNLLAELGKETNRAPQNAELSYDPNTFVVKDFQPARLGLAIDEEKLTSQLAETISSLENSEHKELEVALVVKETKPEKELADTNTLGISEQIGFGESLYYHSIPTRVHNVALTARKINNTIVKPGDEFSFNKALGDVSAATGFQPAYVIKNGRTELGDGGGVCQVSSTLFRAILNAGLPITKRRAHSYRVSYYELNSQPGFDATVYAGDVDLRFANDTGQHLLVHTQVDSTKLYMTVEIYGTSDGRQTEIIDQKTWDFQPAPPASYVDDPTLPPGKIKQIDFPASGIKASFKNVVKDRDGKVLREDEYYSNYRPWRAVYLRGTSP